MVESPEKRRRLCRHKLKALISRRCISFVDRSMHVCLRLPTSAQIHALFIVILFHPGLAPAASAIVRLFRL